jgi:hypothetical protein
MNILQLFLFDVNYALSIEKSWYIVPYMELLFCYYIDSEGKVLLRSEDVIYRMSPK